VRQVFIARGSVNSAQPKVGGGLPTFGENCPDQDAFERKLFVIRKTMEHAVSGLSNGQGKGFYCPSLSSRTIVYKGMLLADQVGKYYLDLQDPRVISALALVHQRFSTNTSRPGTWRIRSG